ncbi:MAG: hypothetical protein QM346_12275 [Chloroflexota bacterium]|nr:hypothetical protein [Chloroflexota bacterium]
MLPFALLLALIWGLAVAGFIEFTDFGRWIAERMTWLSVVAGVGGDMLILLLLIDESGKVAWWHILAVIGLSSLGVIYRGLRQAHGYFRQLMEHAQDRMAQRIDHAAPDQTRQ